MYEIKIPADKLDVDAAQEIVRLGLSPAVVSVLPEVLGCLEDINWPIAQELIPLFRDAGVETVPAIEEVFSGSDDVHKYWLLQVIVPMLSEEAQALLLNTIRRFAFSPTPGEVAEEVSMEAKEYLESQNVT